MDERAQRSFEFGPFRLIPSEHLLLCRDKSVTLTPKAFEMLRVFVENGGKLLDKKDILERVWPGVYVGETTLAQNVFTLRKTLAEADPGRQYIETVPRRGYRFTAEVRELAGGGERAPATKRPGQAPRDEGAINSIAILPFVNVGDDPDLEYLSEGLTDSLINSLSQLKRLRVMSRSLVRRYQGGDVDPRQAGRELSVRAALVGRVTQRADHMLVDVELVDVAGGWQVWGARFDRKMSDIFEVQKEIAHRIFEELKLKLTGEEQELVSKRHTESTEAYHLYLQGRYHWNRRTGEGYERAIWSFRQAIDLDPGYAFAYSGLADCYALQSSAFYGLRSPRETMPLAKAAAARALELDETLAEAHTSLAYILLSYDWDWAGAEREFRRAIELNPGYAHAYHWYAHFLMSQGRADEAYAQSMKALELEPLDLTFNLHLGWFYLYVRDYEKSIVQLRKMLDLESNFYPAQFIYGVALLASGQTEEAIEQFRRASRLGDTATNLSYLGYAYAQAGREGEARHTLAELLESRRAGYLPPYTVALIHTGLGETEQAFTWLERAYEDRSEWMGWLKVNPELDSLRGDPRFAALVRRVGLPQ